MIQLKKLEIYAVRMDKAIVRKGKRVLFKLGGYIRKTMRSSMAYKPLGEKSRPGRPPFAHKQTGAPLRKGIRFQVNLNDKSVIIGPDVRPDSKVLSLKPLPQLLNEGGVAHDLKGQTVTIKPRPFLERAYLLGTKEFLRLVEQEKLRD